MEEASYVADYITNGGDKVRPFVTAVPVLEHTLYRDT